jgi:hypothetical protein
MKFALFSPYGLMHREAGLMYLVANYLVKQGAEVVQMRCDGALPACGRDRKGGGARSPFQCARCLNEQRSLSAWAGAQCRDVSQFLIPEDIKKTAEWIAAVPTSALERVEFRGVNLWSVCVNELRMRWDDLDVSALTEAQEGDLRDLYVAYVRVAVASERLIEQWKPDLTVLSSIQDPMAHAYLLQAKLAGIDAAVCSYQADEEVVVFESLANKERYTTPLALEGITSMRSDPRTWGPEVTAVVHEVLTFLGYPPDRLV